jgi:nitrous oxidase accessory protein NosD
VAARLPLAFTALVLVMAAHQGEHVAQLAQKEAFGNACPSQCRGLLGFLFDIEWVHFAYNVSIFLALAALLGAYWRRRSAAPAAWAALVFGVGVQGYHVAEHSAKIDQWLTNGHRSPTPGLVGQELAAPLPHEFSLIELHFFINTVVFLAAVAAYFGFRAYPRLRVAAATPAVALALLVLGPVPLAWATDPPTVRLAAGVHQGPLVLDHAQKLVGEPGAVVRGGIRVTASGVVVRGVDVVGGEHGIEVVGAKNVVIEDVSISRSTLDGVNVRRSTVSIRDCRVAFLVGEYTQGIDISFAFDLAPSLVEDCRVLGAREGIVSHFARVRLLGNEVVGARLRGITMTEMSMGSAERNVVRDSRGVGIFCGDYSVCRVERNTVEATRPDRTSDDRSRRGYGIQAHFGATATLDGNRLAGNPYDVGAFAEAEIVED